MIKIIENIKISRAIILATIIPILAVVFLGALHVIHDITISRELTSLQQLAKLSVKFSDLLHEQQKERGTSSVFLDSNGKEFKDEMLAQRRLVDFARDGLFDSLETFDTTAYGARFKDQLTYILKELKQMEDTRARVDSLKISAADIIDYFNKLNAGIIELIASMAQLNSNSEASNHINSEIGNSIYAYVNFLRAKESMGIERAVGSVGFSRKEFVRDRYDEFRKLITLQEAFLDVFIGAATDSQKAYYWKRVQGKAVDEVIRMRNVALATPQNVSIVKVLYWYKTITKKINLLKDVEDKIASDLQQKAAHLKTEAMWDELSNILLVATVLIITGVLYGLITHFLNTSFRHLFDAMKEIANGNAETELPKYTKNEIGEMVLAASVFKERLIENNELTKRLSNHKETLEKQVMERTIDLKLRGEELKASEQKLQAIINGSVDTIITIDEKGTVQSFSQSGEKTFGYSAEEVIGENVRILMPSPYHEEHDGYLQNYRKTNEKNIIGTGRKVRAKRKDGTTFPIRLGVSEIDLNEEKLFVGLITDITEEIASREALIRQSLEAQKQKEKALKAARIADEASRSKSEFLTNMSHELRTPLNSLLILARELMDNEEGNLTETQVEDAEVIHESGNDLLTLINDLLDLAKIESGKMDALVEDVPIKKIVQNIRTKFSHVAKGKGLGLNIEIDPTAPDTINSDKLRIEQILRNFLSNALKFTDEGKVSVRIFQPDDATKFYDRKLQASDLLAFAVSDTGIGIPPEKQKDVFEAFQQADGSTTRKYGGTGLGLSISRELAALLGGEIHLESEEGVGSTFTIYVRKKLQPLSTTNRRQRIFHNSLCDTKAAKAASLLRKEDLRLDITNPINDDRDVIDDNDATILVVDDDKRFLKILQDKVRSKGHKCLAADNSILGLQLINKYQVDAVILDIDMPEMNGVDFYERIRRYPDTCDLPVYFISVHDNAPKVSDDNAIGFLSKPVSTEQLEQAFNEIEEVALNPMQHLLIVEDDNNLRDSVVRLMQKRGVEISEARNGLEALEALKTRAPDCILLDLMMPEMDGITFLEHAAKDNKISLPRIVVYSAKDLTEEEAEIIERYTDSFIQKNGESLESAMENIFENAKRVHSRSREEETHVDAPSSPAALNTDDDTEQASYDFSGKKILITDDEPRNIFALSRMLASTNLEIHTALNGQEALNALNEHPDISCILMDIMMPVMNGYEAIEAIRQQNKWATLPIIAVTAKAMPEDQDKCSEVGATEFIAKPVAKDTLLATLSERLT